MSLPAVHVWKPSDSRVVTLDSFVHVPRGSSVAVSPPLNWPAKDPDDVLDYQFDIAPAVAGNDSDGIAGVDVTISPNNPGDLEVSNVSADGSRVILWFSGGQLGTVYTVTILVSTMSGRVINRSVLLPVIPLASTEVILNAIQTTDGQMLTDQAGNPILALG